MEDIKTRESGRAGNHAKMTHRDLFVDRSHCQLGSLVCEEVVRSDMRHLAPEPTNPSVPTKGPLSHSACK